MPEEIDAIFQRKHIECAEGYQLLGMYEDAWAELEQVQVDELPESKDRASYFEVFLTLAMAQSDWSLGEQMAAALREEDPKNPAGYLHGAFCLHELGKTRAALTLLIMAPDFLREEPLYFYNLGCYHAVLGENMLAMACLNEAFQREPELRKTARKDPDLRKLGGLGHV